MFSHENLEIITKEVQGIEIQLGVLRYPEIKSNDIIVLIPGFGSGWTGIGELGLALFRKTSNDLPVYMVSMPGYGNSSDPSDHSLTFESEILAKLLEKIYKESENGVRFHLVGHSMGAHTILFCPAYIKRLSLLSNETRRKLIKSITLLNPAGFHRRSKIGLFLRLTSNGAFHAIWNSIWGKPNEIFGKIQERGPFEPTRLKQRWQELKNLSNTITPEFTEILLREERDIPKLIVTSDYDWVYPFNDKTLKRWDKAMEEFQVHLTTLPRMWHNTTIYHKDKTAERIEGFIRGL